MDACKDIVDPLIWEKLLELLHTLPEVTEDSSVTDPEPLF